MVVPLDKESTIERLLNNVGRDLEDLAILSVLHFRWGGWSFELVKPTPGGELAKRYQQVVDRNPGPVKIKIQEQGGVKVKNKLQRNNPNRTKGCVSTDCMACRTGRGEGGECRNNNVGYELVCDECGGENVCYVGETGQNIYTRGLKHMANYRGKLEESPLWKHAQLQHDKSLTVSFSMKVVKCFADPLTRQVNESVRINNCKAKHQLNSKSEWHGPATIRLVAEGGGWSWVWQKYKKM